MWYSAAYGSWRDPEGVQRLNPTYDRHDIFRRAKEIAKKTGKNVTIQGAKGSDIGIRLEYWMIAPDGIIIQLGKDLPYEQ